MVNIAKDQKVGNYPWSCSLERRGYVNQHEEDGDEQRHPAGHHLHGNEEPDEGDEEEHNAGEVGVAEDRSESPREPKLKAGDRVGLSHRGGDHGSVLQWFESDYVLGDLLKSFIRYEEIGIGKILQNKEVKLNMT